MNGGDPAQPDTSGLTIHDIRYWPGEGPPRVYPADISIRELLYGELDLEDISTNDFIESQFLDPNVDRLVTAFSQARRFPLPVIFDRVGSTSKWEKDPTAFSTSAFTPNVVNLQPIHGRLLIPRPYGPRMKLADAIKVLEAASADFELPDGMLKRITPSWVNQKGLLNGVYWLHRQDSITRPAGTSIRSVYGGLKTKRQVIDQFKDSYPGDSDQQLLQKIIVPNQSHFDANDQLKDGWRKFTLAETMVDLFETWIQAVASELDVKHYWIDS